jgi:competence protein ComEC
VAAELVVVPISATAFGRVTFAGVLLNFVAVPLMAVVQLAGLATVGLGQVAPPLAGVSGWIAHQAVQGIVQSASLADWWPWLQRLTPPPAMGLLVLHAVGLVVACSGLASVRARAFAVACAGCTTAAIAGGWWPAQAAGFGGRTVADVRQPSALRVTMLDVGQGDCIVVQFPSSRVMVVDTGGLAASPSFDIGRRVVSPALHALGAREITWLVLTHGDPDHVGGAAALMSDWRPREVWEGVPVARQGGLQALRTLADRHGIAWRRVRDGDALSVGGVDVLVRHPPLPDWERQRVRNDDSVVLELRYGATSVVLPGDIGASVERQLAALPWAPRLRVLKAAHHGSAGSSEPRWLMALAPKAVLFSAGRGNPFGHPSRVALARAGAVGADAFRTDEDGAVRVVTDGHRLVIETMSGKRWVRTAG